METTLRGNLPSPSGNANYLDGNLGQASSSVHGVVDSVAMAADEAARKARPTIDRAAAMAHQAVDQAASAVAPAADWLAGQGDSLNATQKKLMSDTCSYVSANPLKSVGMAVLAGFLISRFVR